MDDEQEARLGELFRTAASGAPPPGFDAEQVVARSRRITRRRQAVLTGSAVVLLVLVGIGGARVVAGDPGGTPVSSAARAGTPGVSVPYAAPEAADAAGSGDTRSDPLARSGPAAAAAPAVPAEPGAAQAPPLGPGTGECADRQDPALRALVEQVLPEVVGAPAAVTTQECRPGGERGIAVEVDGGLLSVTYLPPGATLANPQGSRIAETASGGTVVLTSRPDRAGGPQPFADRLDETVRYLAPRL